MLQTITFSLAIAIAIASLATAQEITIDTNTPPKATPILPSITGNISALTSPTATLNGTPTTLACIPETDLIFTIQTDTILGNEPASTPVCGVSTSLIPLGPGPVVNLTTTAPYATLNGTTMATQGTLTTASTTAGSGSNSGSSTSAPTGTQSGSPAVKVAVGGGVVGVLGLVAGVLFL